jgi:hypothetical protein
MVDRFVGYVPISGQQSVGWEARLRELLCERQRVDRERIERAEARGRVGQALNGQELADIKAPAAIEVKLSRVEIVAERLRVVFQDLHGVPKGLGWKRADKALRAHGYDDGVWSRSTYHRALDLNRARLTGQSQG